MHASSLENMLRCYEKVIGDAWIESRGGIRVLDVGGANVNGSYRDIFDHPGVRYTAADLADAEGVDLLLEDPYHLPVADAAFDVVISGQMLEHCEFFWQAFTEMARVVKPDGFILLIAPSTGPIHRYPVDCYRFYPDAYRALAKHANCHLIDVWLDERGPWCDLVGIFSKTALPATSQTPASKQRSRSFSRRPAHLEGAISPGTSEEEATRGESDYLEALRTAHRVLMPRCYLEIGVRHGRSLALADCAAVGVDPAPQITEELGSNVHLHEIASDEFFASNATGALPSPPDLVFIDGMHLFEYALRDFMHVERLVQPSSLIVVDDIFPNHPSQAGRERASRVWTGDVWKLYQCLSEMRSDLVLIALDTRPTGMLLIAALDPGNRVLWNSYNPLVSKYAKSTVPPPAMILERQGAFSANDARIQRVLEQLKKIRNENQTSKQIRSALLAILQQ